MQLPAFEEDIGLFLREPNFFCLRYTSNEPVEWQAVPEVGVHIPHDPIVNLASTGLSGDIFHQPGSPCVRGQREY